MNCPLETKETTEVLLDYCNGRLDSATTASVARHIDRHIESCSACADFRRRQTIVWKALDIWEPGPVSVDFNRRLWRRIDAAPAAPWYGNLLESLRIANWRPAFPLAAAALIVAGGFLLDHPRQRAAAPGVSTPGMSALEAEQVEQTLDDLQLLHQLDTVTIPSRGDSKSM